MDRVNIVTATTCKGPAKQKATGMMLIEHIKDGIPNTIYQYLERDSITPKELSLQLLANALIIIKHSNADFDSVEIYSDESYLKSDFENKWLENWTANDWKNAKGKDVADAQLWQQITKLIQKSGKRVIFTSAKSSYYEWMQLQMKLKPEGKHAQEGEIKPRLYLQRGK